MNQKLDLDAQTAAYLYTHFQKTGTKSMQVAIGKQMGVSQSNVSLLLRHARKKGWLQTCFVDTGLDLNKIQDRAFDKHGELRAKLDRLAARCDRKPLTGLHIFNSGSSATNEADYHTRLRVCGQAAAERILELRDRLSLVGVTWGETLLHLVNALRELRPDTSRENTSIRFIPLCGEPLDLHPQAQASSTLASQLQEILTGKPSNISLGAVRACIPCGRNRQGKLKERVLREDRDEIAGYREIFLGSVDVGGDTREPLVKEMDSLITSVGTAAKESRGPWMDDLTKATGLGRDDLGQFFSGNIGGIFVERSDKKLASQVKEKLRLINLTWNGVTAEHLKRCAERASKKRAGVIVVAIG